MSKKPETKAPSRLATMRPKLKLAGMAFVPLVLAAGSGYAGWAYYLGANAEAAGHRAQVPPPISREIAAETSFTHNFAIATIIDGKCGRVNVPALKKASDAEALADGALANLSWHAASRRTHSLDEISCRHFVAEVRAAELRAAKLAKPAGY